MNNVHIFNLFMPSLCGEICIFTYAGPVYLIIEIFSMKTLPVLNFPQPRTLLTMSGMAAMDPRIPPIAPSSPTRNKFC